MKKKYIILIHIFFWLLAGSLNFAFLIFREGVSSQYYIQITIKTIFEALDFYLVYLLIIPRFFNRKKLLVFFLVVIIYLLIFIPIYLTANYFELAVQNIREGKWPTIIQYIQAAYYVVLYAFLGGLFRLSIEGIKSNQQKAFLEKQNAKNELAFLRSQINPHFLFNVLNTIHSFINSNNPNAAKAVIRLSDIMRYMLTDATKELITLEEEVEYLNSYIELQNYRLEKPEFVDFRISGNIKGILLPPLLLIPFVENAFKHGKKEGRSTGISMKLEVNPAYLNFIISNSINPFSGLLNESSDHLGLNNVKRRLELLYPGRHTLKINTFEKEFTVHLHLIMSK